MTKKSNLFPDFSKLVFIDNEKEHEWEEMENALKKSITHNLDQTFSRMENKIAIDLLCHVIKDLEKRIEKLKNK